MNNQIGELDGVKIVALRESYRHFTGTEGVCRPPRVGDRATVVPVLEPGRAFIAEAVDAEGCTLWVADFRAEELALEVKCRGPGTEITNDT